MVIKKSTHKKIIKKIGLDANKDYVLDDDIIELIEKVSSYLQCYGFGKSPEYEVTEEGIACEEILDMFSEIE